MRQVDWLFHVVEEPTTLESQSFIGISPRRLAEPGRPALSLQRSFPPARSSLFRFSLSTSYYPIVHAYRGRPPCITFSVPLIGVERTGLVTMVPFPVISLFL